MGAASRVIGSLGAAALLLAGCTLGEGEQGLVAGGDGAEAVVIAALDAAQSGTGRVEIAYEMDDTAMRAAYERLAAEAPDDASGDDLGMSEEDWDVEPPSFSGVYSGEDFLVSAEGEDTFTSLRVGGRTFHSTDSVLAPYWSSSSGSGEDPEFDGPEPPDLPDGVEWIEAPDGSGGALTGFAVEGGQGLHLVTSDQLSDVTEVGASDVGGAATRYRASLTPDRFAELLGFPTGEDDAAQDEDDALGQYFVDHTTVEVEIHLSDDDRLVRLGVTTSTAIEPEYAECMMLLSVGSPITVIADYSDPGTAVDLAEPQASAILSQDDFDDLMMDSFESWAPAGTESFPDMPSERAFDAAGEPIKMATAAGERYRGDIENDLTKFGSVIGLDPATVDELDDVALVDAHDRAAIAIAALPTTTTALGELTRVELLWIVRWGLGVAGGDPATAEAMTDAQLGALIDGFVDEVGISGDGIWGDGPMSLADMESAIADDELMDPEHHPEQDPEHDGESDEFDAFADMFEGCPS